MKTLTIVGVLIVVVIIGGVLIFAGDSDNPDDIAVDSSKGEIDNGTTAEENKFDKAPNFTFPDYDGNEVTGADFEGKVLVLNSWATWCPFCINELPDFAALQKEFPNEIVIIAINREESRDRAKEFSDRLLVTDDMIFLLDSKDSFYRGIGGFSMPETLFVDSDGNIRVHKRGIMTLSEMREHVNTALAEL